MKKYILLIFLLSTNLIGAPANFLYYNDFSSSLGGEWVTHGGNWSVNNGVLNGYAASDGGYIGVNSNWYNFSIEADMRFNSSPAWGICLGGRYNPQTGANYSMWLYLPHNDNGRVTIEKYNDWYNTWWALGQYSLSSSPGTNWHHLKLVLNNNNFVGYYDDNLVLNVNDSGSVLPSGGVCCSFWTAFDGQTTYGSWDNLVVYPYPPITNNPPSIVIQPTSKLITNSQLFTLSVAAAGTEPLSYQWYFNNRKIKKETSSSFTRVGSLTTAGNYYVVVANDYGAITSSTVTVLVFQLTNIIVNLSWIYPNISEVDHFTVMGSTNLMNWMTLDNVGKSTNVTYYYAKTASNIQWYFYVKAYVISGSTNRSARVGLAWDKSPGTNVISDYRVYYGTASKTYTNSLTVGTNLTATVSNLISGNTYYFSATAIDTSRLESDYSNEVFTNVPFLTPVTNIVGINCNIEVLR